jgi:outer membrane protein OmpA-like peptidoglycan-associated protein
VYDAVTKKPIDANISFSNNILPDIKSDSTTGSFKIEKVRTGVFTIEAKKDGYFPKAVTVSVEDGKITQVDLPLTASITQALFNGKISIKESGEPLAAQITFLNNSLAPILSDNITGVFQTQIPIGTYSVNITDSGFLPYTGVVTIEPGKTNQYNFELIPSQFQTIITGKVSDKKTGRALNATISLPETGIQPAITDSINGVYRIEVPVGTYLIEVKSNNYITQTAMIVLEKNKPLEKNFEMVKQGMVIILKGIYFESGKATLKPESYSALQDAAKILTDNPNIKVEIQGHTDNVGSDSYNQTLSEKRAYAVMNYLVTSLGIIPGRLSANGYGELKPIASNDTEESRAFNRRVDFIILGK